MKRFVFLVLALALLALPVSATEYSHFTNLAFTGYFGVGEEGSETAIFDSSGNMTVAGTFAHTGATASFTNATSFIAYTPNFTVGYDSGSYVKFAVADTSGALTVTHTGNATAVGWTVATWANTNATSYTTYTPSWVLGYDAGASSTVAVSDTTGNWAMTHTGSTKNVSWTTTGAATFNFGSLLLDSAILTMDSGATIDNTSSATILAITETTIDLIGATLADALTLSDVLTFSDGGTIDNTAADTLTITEANIDLVGALAADAVTLSDVLTFSDGGTIDNTAAAVLTITEGTIDLVGALAADATTLSDVLTFSDGGTIDNTGADDLTITEVNIILEGVTKTNALTIDDGHEDVKIDSDNQTATLPTISIPDFTDATADFLVTNLFTTVLPFNGGLAGEDTDAVGTNGAGLVGGGAIDITTYDYNDGAAGANDVLVKVYDAGTTTWDDLKTAALLTAGADWAINYQLLPDADAEAENDCFAIGFDEMFCEFTFNDLATDAGALATWGGDGAKWQYSTGAGTWSDLTAFDNTDATAQDGKRPLQRAGSVSFVPPADWAKATYDGEEAYWVRCLVTAAQLTQTPVIDTTNHDEPIIPFPTDGLSAPFKLEVTKVRVANMHTTVHDQAIVFVVGNFTDGTFSAAQTWAASQLCDTFTLASAIAADPGDVIGILCTNDTASTNNPVWAVEFTVTYED